VLRGGNSTGSKLNLPFLDEVGSASIGAVRKAIIIVI
jgi:hypothetical protein